MVKFLVLGGAGDMGSSAVEDLARSNVEEIVIGDLGSERAQKILEKLKGAETSIGFEKIDVNDKYALSSAIKDSDIVINTIGPFYKYEKIVIDSAMESGKDYVDICDDHDATLEVFNRKNSIDNGSSRILVGMGWTPGITNVLSRAAYNELDSTSDIDIAWTGSAADASGQAVISHVFHAVTGDVPVYLDGRTEMVPARQLRKETIFPAPINKVETYVVGHPEPITIPIFLDGVKNVVLRGALLPAWQNHLVSQFADIGLTEDTYVDVGGHTVSAREFLSSFVHQTMSQFKSGGVEVSGFHVNATGTINGTQTSIIYSGADKMQRLTGWSASIGAQYIAANGDIRAGLYAPEGIIDPSFFIGELKKRNIGVHKQRIVTEE